MDGLLQLLLYGFIYWLIMGRRSKKKKKRQSGVPGQMEKKAVPARTTAPGESSRQPVRARQRVESVPADEEDDFDPFEELRGALMQEGRAEERGLRPSRDRSPNLRGRLESVREQREESRRESEEKLRAMEADRERQTVADVVSFDAATEKVRRDPVSRPGKRDVRLPVSRRRAILRNLREPRRLRDAIILAEVLAPPAAKRPPRKGPLSR